MGELRTTIKIVSPNITELRISFVGDAKVLALIAKARAYKNPADKLDYNVALLQCISRVRAAIALRQAEARVLVGGKYMMSAQVDFMHATMRNAVEVVNKLDAWRDQISKTVEPAMKLEDDIRALKLGMKRIISDACFVANIATRNKVRLAESIALLERITDGHR